MNTTQTKNQMTVTFQPTIEDQTYNGWSNYETWNVALWIQNDEGLYEFAKGCTDYKEVIEVLYDCGSKETPDGVKWNDKKLNHIELNEMLQDL
jgi:hypothetical protein